MTLEDLTFIELIVLKFTGYILEGMSEEYK